MTKQEKQLQQIEERREQIQAEQARVQRIKRVRKIHNFGLGVSLLAQLGYSGLRALPHMFSNYLQPIIIWGAVWAGIGMAYANNVGGFGDWVDGVLGKGAEKVRKEGSKFINNLVGTGTTEFNNEVVPFTLAAHPSKPVENVSFGMSDGQAQNGAAPAKEQKAKSVNAALARTMAIRSNTCCKAA